MPAVQLFSTINYISSLVKMAASKGVHLEIGTDFFAFREIQITEAKKGNVAPIFDPDFSEVSPANAFWIKGLNDHGEVVHTQAARLLDLSGVSLSDHLGHALRDFWADRDRVNMERSRICLSPVTAKMTGKLCYHGELWLKSGRNNLAGSLTATLTRMLPALASLLWEPDYFFGFLSPFAACKGLLAREGYTHLEQGSIFWHLDGEPEPTEDWLGWMSQEDLEHLMQVPPENFDTWYQGRDRNA
jgi:hypothetical protein